MKLKHILYFSLFLISSTLFSQSQLKQTVRGQITDKISAIGLPGVIVRMKNDSTKKLVTTTDEKGNFKIEGIPVGRRSFIASYIGYNPIILNDIIITSGKEVFLNMELEESLFQKWNIRLY